MATKHITATATFPDGREEDFTESASWSSSDESVATVEGGRITAVSPGKCIVTATAADGVTAEIAVTVPPPKAKS